MIEEWKPVVGWELYYEVSNLGRVRSLDRVVQVRGSRPHMRLFKGKPIKPREHKGYAYCDLTVGDLSKTFSIHKLVLESFIGQRPSDLHDCCHNDGNKSNNILSNLRWDTKKANQADRLDHGTDSRGEKSHLAKLSAEEVVRIRAMLNDGIYHKDIAKLFGVNRTTITQINLNNTWR
jgi:hypothetical protein